MTHKDLILAQCRKRGIKLKDLAKRLGVPQSTLSETMRRGKPDYATLERLKLQIDVMTALHEEVCMIEHDMYNHHLASKRDAAKICSDYLDWVGVEK